MKYLVIGDANSMHIYNFTKNFLIPKGYEIHLLTLATQPVREEYRRFYKKNKIILHSVAEKNYKGLDKTDRLHRMINLIRKLKLMKDVPKVDICHLQSVYKTSVMMILHNKRKYKKLVLSYWGGDLEVCSKKILKFMEKALNRADSITVTVKKVLDDNNIKILSSEIKLIPNSTVDISEEDESKLNRFIDQCDDDEDIQ